MSSKKYSYTLEKEYYSSGWPTKAAPYRHLMPYITCWLDPKIFENKLMLDIGAGECAYTRLIAENFNPKQMVASELFIERMLPAARENKNGKINFVQSDIFHLPFADKSFDLAFGSLVLEQLPEIDTCIAEISRVLTDRGTFIGLEANPFNVKHLYRYYFSAHSKNQFLFRKKHVKLFEKHGFKISIKYFYPKYSWAKNRIAGTLMGFVASRNPK